MATGKELLVPFVLAALAGPIGAGINRGDIRKAFEIEGGFISDCLIHWCCAPCATC